MRKYGASQQQAIHLLTEVGDAHEADSWLHVYDQEYSINSSLMDEWNNDHGAALGARLAREHAAAGISIEDGQKLLANEVLEGIASGAYVTMKGGLHDAPTRSVWQDVALADPDDASKPMRDVQGRLVLRNFSTSDPRHLPDTPGFPSPITADHQIDLTQGYARLDPGNVHTPRQRLPEKWAPAS